MDTVLIRNVEPGDLPTFFEQQNDPVANRLAAFPPRDREAFMAHWAKILDDDAVVKKTIVFEGEIAGNIVCYEQCGTRRVGYWLGRPFWGQGVASRALKAFLQEVSLRPLEAHVFKENIASARVLEKCGFRLTGEAREPAPSGGEVAEEFVFTLVE